MLKRVGLSELKRTIGQRHDDQDARADGKIGKGDVQVVHVAFDAVRVHGLSRMMGFITLHGGVGAWLPPQARTNLSGRRSGTLEPVGGQAPGKEKTVLFSKALIT